MPERILVSCEHASNAIPAAYAGCFAGAEDVLRGHRGHDPGAIEVARVLARSLGVPFFAGRVSRLLVDLNRSPWHPRLFSEFVRDLPAEDKQRIIAGWYEPYRQSVERAVSREIGHRGEVLHLSIHSFVPELGGQLRQADLGLLYDPRRRAEREFCLRLRDEVLAIAPALRVRRNYPYRGVADGLATYLRRKFPRGYTGVEIELNQACLTSASDTDRMAGVLARAVPRAVDPSA